MVDVKYYVQNSSLLSCGLGCLLYCVGSGGIMGPPTDNSDIASTNSVTLRLLQCVDEIEHYFYHPRDITATEAGGGQGR